MDQETVLEHFAKLEKRIEYLIQTCKQLEADNTELKEENRNLASQIQDKLEAEQKNNELKGVIRSRIDSLMGRLEEFSGSQEENH